MICIKCGRKSHFGTPCKYDGQEKDVECDEAERAEMNEEEGEKDEKPEE